MTWWVALASFLGAVVGATIPALVDLRGQHQQARTEWSQRLDRAISALTSPAPLSHDIGQELLTALIRSDLGSPADRDLARRLSRVAVTGGTVDQGDRLRDNEGDEQERP